MYNRTFYAQKVEVWIAEDNFSTYMIHVEKVLKDVRQLVAGFMNSVSEEKLVQVLLLYHASEIIVYSFSHTFYLQYDFFLIVLMWF